MDLQGVSALVTGGAKGLGLAMARGVAQHGAPIVLADIDDATGEQAAKDLAAETGVELRVHINPDGVAQGIGSALYEEIMIDDAGRVLARRAEWCCCGCGWSRSPREE